MVKGFNSDFQISGKHYHLQSEDWGNQNPFLVTRLYCQGAVVKTIKRSYVEVFGTVRIASDVVKIALKHQHEELAKELVLGRTI
jgi:hypothetical protein